MYCSSYTWTCWKLYTQFNSNLAVYIHLSLTNQWKGEQPGSQGKRQLCGMESPPQTYTTQIPKECLIYCVRALFSYSYIQSFHCAQQGKSILPLCIWRGFHLFWSTLHRAGVKIGVCFSSALLKVHLISQAHTRNWAEKSNSNTQSSAPKVELKRKKNTSTIVWPSVRQTQHRWDQGRV